MFQYIFDKAELRQQLNMFDCACRTVAVSGPFPLIDQSNSFQHKSSQSSVSLYYNLQNVYNLFNIGNADVVFRDSSQIEAAVVVQNEIPCAEFILAPLAILQKEFHNMIFALTKNGTDLEFSVSVLLAFIFRNLYKTASGLPRFTSSK